MSKEEFLDKLRRRLVVLNESEIEDIIVEYGDFIDEKVKKGKTEEEAINEFGNFNELVKEILSAYKINDDKDIAKNMFMNFFNDVTRTFERIIKDLSNKDFNQIAKFIFEILVIIIIIAIFKWPVELIIRLGRDIFSILPQPLYSIIFGLWRFILEVGYLILAVIFFVKIFKERYLKKSSETEEKVEPSKTASKSEKKTTKKDEKASEEKINDTIKKVREKEVKKTKENKDDDFSFLGKLFSFIFKIFLMIMLMPTFGILLSLIIAFCLGVGLFISGVHYIGILITIFAMLSFAIFFTELIFKIIFNHKLRGTKIFIWLIVNFVLLGAGISIASFEIANSDFINRVPDNFKATIVTEEFSSDKIDFIDYWYRVEFVVNEELNDKIIVTAEHYEDFSEVRMTLEGGILFLQPRNLLVFPNRVIYQSLIENLRNREIYNYTGLTRINYRIYANSETIERLEFERLKKYLAEEYYWSQEKHLENERDYWQQKYYDLLDQRN